MAILEAVLKSFAHNFSLNKDAVKALVKFDNMEGALTERAALDIIKKSGATLNDRQRKALLDEFISDPQVASGLKSYSEALKAGKPQQIVQFHKDNLDSYLQARALKDPLKEVEGQLGSDEWIRRMTKGPKVGDYTRGLGTSNPESSAAKAEDLISKGRQKLLDDQVEGERRLNEYKKESSIKQAGQSITTQGNVTGIDFQSLRKVKSEYGVDFSTLKKKD